MIYLVSNTKFDHPQVRQLAVCEIKFLKFSLPAHTGALIFTSKNAVAAIKFNEISLDLDTPVYAIGEPCAAAAREFGFRGIYTAWHGHGNEFAAEIAPLLRGRDALYLRARQTVSKLEQILSSAGVRLQSMIAYENSILSLPAAAKPPQGSTLIFTSPKNVRGFTANFGWDGGYRAICIGRTTASVLSEFCEPIICERRSIKSCVDLALLP